MAEEIEVFVVTREGVYRHEIPGVFTSEEKAQKYADKMKATEPDGYHEYEVHKRILDREVEYDRRDGFSGYFNEDEGHEKEVK